MITKAFYWCMVSDAFAAATASWVGGKGWTPILHTDDKLVLYQGSALVVCNVITGMTVQYCTVRYTPISLRNNHFRVFRSHHRRYYPRRSTMGQAGYPDPAFETLGLKFLGRDTMGAHFAPCAVIQDTVLFFATAS